MTYDDDGIEPIATEPMIEGLRSWVRRRLTMRGAKKIATVAPGNEIDRLWREADNAAAALEVALRFAAEGTSLRALPEYEEWSVAAEAFRMAAEGKLHSGEVVIHG